VHYGWIVVAVAFTVLFLAYGVQYAFGLFFTALTEEFGWSRPACPASSPSTPPPTRSSASPPAD